MIRKMLDKDKWERYRRAVWVIDSEDTDSEGNDSEDTIESLGGEQKVAVKKTVSFKKFYSVIRGDMGLTDRRREADYDRADTMFLRCRDGSQSLQGHAVHEGIMELDPVELGIWNRHGGAAEWNYSRVRLDRQEFDPLQYRPTHNKLKKIGKKLQEHVQRQWARSRIRHWQTVTRYLGLGAHLISMQKPVWDTDNMCFQIPKDATRGCGRDRPRTRCDCAAIQIQVESKMPSFAGTDMEGDSSSDGEGREETAAEAAAEKAEASEQADGGSRR